MFDNKEVAEHFPPNVCLRRGYGQILLNKEVTGAIFTVFQELVPKWESLLWIAILASVNFEVIAPTRL
jgi:hypothetical protein